VRPREGRPLGTVTGPKRDRFRSAIVCATAAVGMASAQSPSPRADTGVRAGAIVSYQETPGSNIVYHEAKGGMVTAVPPPVPMKREPSAAPSKGNGANGGSGEQKLAAAPKAARARERDAAKP